MQKAQSPKWVKEFVSMSLVFAAGDSGTKLARANPSGKRHRVLGGLWSLSFDPGAEFCKPLGLLCCGKPTTNLVDPASCHMLVSRTKPCKCQSTRDLSREVCVRLIKRFIVYPTKDAFACPMG